jgi:hypothetical protein
MESWRAVNETPMSERTLAVRAFKIVVGVFLGASLILLLWFTGVLQPPERLQRRVVSFVTLYPQPSSEAEVGRIECPPLRRRQLYVICTNDCEEVWRIVGATGLRVENLKNLNRIPPEPGEESRRRLNDFLVREGLHLDERGAREMIGCHMRVEGLLPELMLSDADMRELARARGSEEEMRRLADRLGHPAALGRMTISPYEEGFESEFRYWDTARLGRPVFEVRCRVSFDGRLLSVWARELPATGDTADDSIPGRSPI